MRILPRHVTRILRVAAITLLVTLVGVFLLIGDLRSQLLAWLPALARRLYAAMLDSANLIVAATVIVFCVIVVTLFFMRLRLLRVTRRRNDNCPHCGGQLARLHRNLIERLAVMILFVNIYRYRCIDCQWEGYLRRRRS